MGNAHSTRFVAMGCQKRHFFAAFEGQQGTYWLAGAVAAQMRGGFFRVIGNRFVSFCPSAQFVTRHKTRFPL